VVAIEYPAVSVVGIVEVSPNSQSILIEFGFVS